MNFCLVKLLKNFWQKEMDKNFSYLFEYLPKSEGLKHPASTQNLIFYLLNEKKMPLCIKQKDMSTKKKLPCHLST